MGMGLALLLALSAAQTTVGQVSEDAGVRATISLYLEGQATGNPDYYRQAFHPDARLHGVRDGKPEQVLVDSLKDKAPGKRAAAGAALVRAGVAGHKEAVAKLLEDPEAIVRLRVSLALVEGKQKNAIPALIGTFGKLNPDQLWRAEELMIRPPLTLLRKRSSLGTIDGATRAKRGLDAMRWTLRLNQLPGSAGTARACQNANRRRFLPASREEPPPERWSGTGRPRSRPCRRACRRQPPSRACRR